MRPPSTRVGPRYSNAVAAPYSDAVESTVLHAVLETSTFSRRADALLSREERAELIETLARNPRDGDLVPGLGGVRKLRFAPKGRGKSGAFRVIYYMLSEEMPILALLIYGKNEQVNPTPEQTRAMAAVVAEFKVETTRRR
jgi:mRNA-degrading endonuclease RelE of RelBE toxin-antitoxin system